MKQTSEFNNQADATTIALFFSDTGGGHRSAVEAIQAAIEQICAERGTKKPVRVVTDNIAENSHPINRCFVQFYNFLLRRNQAMMKYYYAFVEAAKPNDSEMAWKIARPYVEKTLRSIDPDLTVSVHPMCNQMLARGLKESGLKSKSKLVTVVTDPNGDFWSGWACRDSDLTVAPNDLSKQRLLDLGVQESKVSVVGMPVHPYFRNPATSSKEEFRHNLGLTRELPTICINAGWAGGGNMMDIYRALLKVTRPVQVIFLCGHNQKLYATMKREARRSPIPTAVLPFHDRMSDVMAACDLMVTKAGGLTTFEAIARRLPMAIDTITTPMPQELGTAQILVKEGLGKRINKADDIVSIVEEMSLRDDFAKQPLPVAHQLDRVDAVFDIAERLLKMASVEFAKAPIGSILDSVGSSILDSGDTVASCSSPI